MKPTTLARGRRPSRSPDYSTRKESEHSGLFADGSGKCSMPTRAERQCGARGSRWQPHLFHTPKASSPKSLRTVSFDGDVDCPAAYTEIMLYGDASAILAA